MLSRTVANHLRHVAPWLKRGAAARCAPVVTAIADPPTIGTASKAVKVAVPPQRHAACAYSNFVSTQTAASFLDTFFSPAPKPLAAGSPITATAAAATAGTATAAPAPLSHPEVVPAYKGQVALIGGRVVAVRDMGRVVFLTLRSDGRQVQVMCAASEALSKDAVRAVAREIRAGDLVGVAGVAVVSRRGEPSLEARSVVLLAPYACSDVACPDLTGYVLPTEQDLVYRYRFIDLMCNASSADVFRRRHKILSALRKYLDTKGFVEVETPVFHTVAGGAAAKPFVTHHAANDASLFLRVAPELYLKQCVVGGLERVYELGRVFRNEGSDRSHNPEFTTCEFYMAYATYRDLMPMTEEIFRAICVAARGVPRFEVSIPGAAEPVTIDLEKPFAVVDIVPALEAAMGITFPRPLDHLNTVEGAALLQELLTVHRVQMPTPATPTKLFDKLIDHFITDHVVQPTFVINHPAFMCPLAKAHADGSGLSERFELFVNGMEVANSYSELNDPAEQKRRFEQQLQQRVEYGDEEAQCMDEVFLRALQVGLPPTAGWGMGIDRVVMLICGGRSIRDVLLFPLLRSDEATSGKDTKRRRAAAGFFGFDPFMTRFCLNALEAEMRRRGDPCGQLIALRSAVEVIAREGPTSVKSRHARDEIMAQVRNEVTAASPKGSNPALWALPLVAALTVPRERVNDLERALLDVMCRPWW